MHGVFGVDYNFCFHLIRILKGLNYPVKVFHQWGNKPNSTFHPSRPVDVHISICSSVNPKYNLGFSGSFDIPYEEK